MYSVSLAPTRGFGRRAYCAKRSWLLVRAWRDLHAVHVWRSRKRVYFHALTGKVTVLALLLLGLKIVAKRSSQRQSYVEKWSRSNVRSQSNQPKVPRPHEEVVHLNLLLGTVDSHGWESLQFSTRNSSLTELIPSACLVFPKFKQARHLFVLWRVFQTRHDLLEIESESESSSSSE